MSLNNKEIARMTAKHCFKPNDRESFAVQVFIEKVVLPDNFGSYTLDEMEEHILNKLEELDD